MKKNRTLIVMAIAIAIASVAAYGVYTAIQSIPVREVEVASVEVVVASQRLPVGTRLTADHLRVVGWPESTQVPGAVADPGELVGRGVIATIAENEPVTLTKVAGPESGAGLPPVIPNGMRAMSVRVNDVIGVAGFVLPGTRVDVLVTVRNPGEGNGPNEAMSRTVVSNVEVLTSGTRYDQEESLQGEPRQSAVVTLAVLPEDGERIALASNEGTISLALRNPLDVEPTETEGIRLAALMRGTGPEPVEDPVRQRVVPARPATPSPPPIYIVETIRAAERSQEEVDR
jgi:pilus assembly protein CpaB